MTIATLKSNAQFQTFFGHEIRDHRFLVAILDRKISYLGDNSVIKTKLKLFQKIALHVNHKTLSCFLTRDTIASALGVSTRQVTRLTTFLSSQNLINVRRGGLTAIGTKVPNTYTLNLAALEKWLINLMTIAKSRREPTPLPPPQPTLADDVKTVVAYANLRYDQKVQENKIQNRSIVSANALKTAIATRSQMKLDAELIEFNLECEERARAAVSQDVGLGITAKLKAKFWGKKAVVEQVVDAESDEWDW